MGKAHLGCGLGTHLHRSIMLLVRWAVLGLWAKISYRERYGDGTARGAPVYGRQHIPEKE
ncbi:hypothetical protein KDI_42200 [Dictyobacter arantiisoli]|uniref:Uncharacterized protein n=1 Tax=Dictyobacter arantiisoli TaxID=2014874 RepID=A0A5A5THN5_9CHLR|nr:hypothetical protein KDI_42200 [Dictyobacter arantiisoli]